MQFKANATSYIGMADSTTKVSVLHSVVYGSLFIIKIDLTIPVYTAVLRGDPTTIEILIDLGASVMKTNSKGETVIKMANSQEGHFPEKFHRISPILKRNLLSVTDDEVF